MKDSPLVWFPGILVTKNGYSWSYSYSYSYSMKWYSYSKGATETDPVNVPTANPLKCFAIGVRP
jgi:hypothetical protein